MTRFSVPQRSTAGVEQGLFSLAEVDRPTFQRLVRRSCDFARDPDDHGQPLAGRVFGILFTKTSTRTRTAFTTAVIRLGGTAVTYGPGDLQTNTGESLADTGRILGLMLDGLVARTAGPLAELRTLARAGGIPVVNAMATEEHPSQGLCDIATLALCTEGGLDGLRMLYVGEGNNTATALAHGMAKIPHSRTTFAVPSGYGVPADVLAAANEHGAAVGAELTQVHGLDELAEDYDVVYTTRWQTTGSSKPDPNWREAFRPFYVDGKLMSRWPEAVFLHDLPAHRGEEVAGEVLDGPRSLAWVQASMKLASAMAILEWVAEQA